MKLEALKKLKYPRTTGGKEYQPGDKFEALSERDYKVLTTLKIAKPAENQAPPATQRAPRRAKQDQPAEQRSLDVGQNGPSVMQESDASRYLRRDMRSED